MAVKAQCEFLTGPANDEETECGVNGAYFVKAAPELPEMRGTTYCKAHANVVTGDPVGGILWMTDDDEWMPIAEALAVA